MMRKMQIVAYLGAVSAALFAHTNASAIEADVAVDAEFRQAITLSVSQTIDFTPGGRSLEYTDVTNITGVTDYVSIATNGAMSNPGGSRLTTGYATGNRGELAFTGEDASVSISCNTNTRLSESGGVDLLLTNAELDVAPTIGAVGAALGAGDYDCAGLGTTPYTYVITGNAGVIAAGGRLEGVANMPSGLYSSTNVAEGGIPMTVRVVYGP